MHHAHTSMHTCTHTPTCMLNMDASMLGDICNFYTCIHVRVCMHMHVHMCRDISIPPDGSRHPINLPHPQSCREPKTPKFNKNELIKKFLLFEYSLPLNSPELI